MLCCFFHPIYACDYGPMQCWISRNPDLIITWCPKIEEITYINCLILTKPSAALLTHLDRWYGSVDRLRLLFLVLWAGDGPLAERERGLTRAPASGMRVPGRRMGRLRIEDRGERIEDTHPPHRDTSLSLAAVTSHTLGRSHITWRYIAQQTHRKPKLNCEAQARVRQGRARDGLKGLKA